MAGSLLTAAVGMAFVETKTSGPSSPSTSATELRSPGLLAFAFKKGEPDRIKALKNVRTVPVPENRSPDMGYEAEQAAIRAYPAADVSLEATLNAQQSFASIKSKSKNAAGAWQLIGPSKATYPGVLNQFLGDGDQYVASGRVTALAIAPTCTNSNCTLYLGAAGGGVWRTTKALSGNMGWEFISGSFDTNAIGSLTIDPNDPTGKTVYAGTGESHVSGDSEAGMGIYKTTDGGNTWTLLPGSVTPPSNFRGRAIGSIEIAPNGNILVAVSRAIRGYSGNTGGATSNPPPSTSPATFGVYRSTDGGATFTDISGLLGGTIRGMNLVRVDPNTPTTLYTGVLGQGLWRSTNNGTSWTQIKGPLDPTASFDRSEFALNKLPAGKTRMYLGQGADAFTPATEARFFRTDDAAGAAVFADMTTPQNQNYCTGQCWYDNYVVSPKGHPDIVYLGGSFSYDQILAFGSGRSNGRAVLLSSDGGATFSDLTQDGDPNQAEAIHPDQHALVVNPNDPYQIFEGSDGGMIRTDGKFADVSSKCDQRGLSAADTAYCKSLLSRVPNSIVHLNDGLSTLQFNSLSVSKQRPKNNLQGGTQDNGTWQYTGSSVVWWQEIYGDGGQSGFNVADDGLRFNTFFGQASDMNFRNGAPTKWVIGTGPIVSSPEGSNFYPPIIADPNAAAAGTIFQGSFSVWRTQDWGGDPAYLEANCPEFTTSAADPACGDFVIIGDGVPSTQLTSAAWGTRDGGAVSRIARAPGNTGTLWASTNTGRLFISDNGAAAAASVVWTRLDTTPTATNDPGRFISGIYVDPSDPHRAWVSYSGYNFNTPAQPGHVFEVVWDGVNATWTNLDGGTGPMGDLPVTDIVRDDVTGTLYASTDFGVLKYDGVSWTLAGTGMPMVEVAGLTIVPSERLLYAATHGRSAWSLKLP